MYFVVAHYWQKNEYETARTIAETMDILTYEARQKILDGGPVVLTSFANQNQANELATRLTQNGIPALVIDPVATRIKRPFEVSRFVIEEQTLQLESADGADCDIPFDTIELLLSATYSYELKEGTITVSERRFSLGKTMLAGGVPMTKRVKKEKSVMLLERDETLWLYRKGELPFIFNRVALNYDGLADALHLTQNLNFIHLKNRLRQLAPQAIYDDRLLKRSRLIRLLGSTLNPDVDLDLACEILARSLRSESVPTSVNS